MKELTVALCDDENFALQSVSSTVEAFFEKRHVACRVICYRSSVKLFKEISDGNFDLLLLDVDMPDMDGIALGKALRDAGDRTEIIYISNREDRVFESFAVRPFGFIRKNNFIKDAAVVLDSFYNSYGKKLSVANEKTHINFKSGTAVVSYCTDDIIYIEGQGREQTIHFYDGHSETVRYTLREITEKLEKCGFKRVHKAFIVNGAAISLIKQYEIILTDGSSVPINPRNAIEIKKWFMERLKNSGSIIF